jgi:hypothetical protein
MDLLILTRFRLREHVMLIPLVKPEITEHLMK